MMTQESEVIKSIFRRFNLCFCHHIFLKIKLALLKETYLFTILNVLSKIKRLTDSRAMIGTCFSLVCRLKNNSPKLLVVVENLLAIQSNAANSQQCKEMILNLNMYGRIASASCQTLSKIQVCKY